MTALLFRPKSLCAQSQSGVLCHVTTWANGQKRVPGHFPCPPGPAVSWIFVGARSLLEAQGSYSGMDIGQVGCPDGYRNWPGPSLPCQVGEEDWL